jgi:sulfur-oxidizing protein SoxY
MQRRRVLETGLIAAPLASLGLGGLLTARTAAAAPPAWPSEAFHAEALDDVMAQLFDGRSMTDSDRITIGTPDIAENGSIVPVDVVADLPGIERITLLSDGNPFPLLARARLTPAVAPKVSIRVKMGQSANLIAVAEADGGLYKAARAVKVTAGGCGGG